MVEGLVRSVCPTKSLARAVQKQCARLQDTCTKSAPMSKRQSEALRDKSLHKRGKHQNKENSSRIVVFGQVRACDGPEEMLQPQ